MKRSIIGLSTLAVLTTLVGCAGRDRPPDARQVAFLGCLFDAGTETAYVANTKDGIDALHFNTGEVRWSAAVKGKPLALLGERLVIQTPEPGQANAIRLAVLNIARKGDCLLVSDPVVFPEWVNVGVVHNRSFYSCGCITEGALLLKWRARAWWGGGHPPSRKQEKDAEKYAEGTARINLTSGVVEKIDLKLLPATVPRQLDRELDKAVARKGHTFLYSAPNPLVVGDSLVTIAEDIRPGERTLVLKRRKVKTNEDLESIAIKRGIAFDWDVLPDERSLLVRQPVGERQLAPDETGWFVYSLETGKQLARFPHEEETRGITVLKTTAFYIVLGSKKKKRSGGGTWTQTLKALDVKTGRILWQRDIEDYQEPFFPQ